MSLLDIGISGLGVTQTSLQITGNNIANADQASYSRQRAEVATRPEQFRSGGYIGAGSIVSNITRVVDDFLSTQIRLDTGSYSNLDIYSTNVNQLDSLLAGDGSGLSQSISDFYSALESSIQDPTSVPARQVVISQAKAMVQRFNTLSSSVEQQTASVNEQMDSLIQQVTTIAQGIADVNKAIDVQTGKGDGASPNQLLDQRDELLRKLSELVSVSTVKNGNSINVFVGNGQPLVVGNEAAKLTTQASTREPGNTEIMYVGQNGVPQQITDFVKGGKIGGLLDFRDNVIPLALNSMGRISLAMADTLNKQNHLGLDLEGNLGGDIFTGINSGSQPAQRVVADTNNTGSSTVVANIANVNQLSVADYTMTWTSATNYQIVRSTDNSVVTGTVGAFPATINIDGVNIDVTGTPAAGDQFYIRPTRTAATSMSMDMQRLQELAYAAPITTDADIGNTGSGSISPGSMIELLNGPGEPFEFTGGAGPQLQPPTMIRFSSATNYTVYDNTDPAAPVALFSGTMIPGQKNDVFLNSPGSLPQYTGYQVQLSGYPAAGDEFTINFNADGSSDNRNGAALGQTRVAETLDNSTTNFENAYGSLIEQVGTEAAKTNVSRDAAKSLLNQSQANRDAISGVNMDEEASNLIRYQQAYSANAQVINIARSIFDSLLSALR